MLEDIGANWEATTQMSDAIPEELNSRHGHGRDPILLGEYRIDTFKERWELFGFLILLQVKQLGAFSQTLGSRAEQEKWDSHRVALRPVNLRIRELHEVLVGMNADVLTP